MPTLDDSTGESFAVAESEIAPGGSPAQTVQPFIFGNSIIAPGERMVVDIPFGKLYTHTELNIGAHVLHGKKTGPGATDHGGLAWR